MLKQQMTLPLSQRPQRDRASLIEQNSNRLALALLDQPDNWHNGTAIIFGEECAGKSHMLEVFASANRIVPLGAESLYLSYTAPFLAVDGLERIGGDRRAEETLFHILNRAMTGQMQVLMASRGPVSALGLATPDLRSRLLAASSAQIQAPEQELLAQLLTKHFADAQVEVKSNVVDFLASRIERSYAAAARSVAVVNSLALVERRAITIPLVKDALQL